jgi:hypothetical protein
MFSTGYAQSIRGAPGNPTSGGLERENQRLKQLFNTLGEKLQEATHILAQAGHFQSEQSALGQGSPIPQGPVGASHHEPTSRKFHCHDGGTDWNTLQFPSAFPPAQASVGDPGLSGRNFSQEPDGMNDWLDLPSTPMGGDRLVWSNPEDVALYEQLHASRYLPVPKPSLFCQDILHVEGMIKHIMLTQPEHDAPHRYVAILTSRLV